MKQIRITMSILLLCMGISVQAQQSTGAAGGDATGTGGTVAYSVGQVVYTRVVDTSGTVNQGVQQPYEISTVGIEEAKSNPSLSLFPNPATYSLTLQTSEYDNEKMLYQLFDTEGKLVIHGAVNAQQTQIPTTGLSSGTYFMSVTNPKGQKIKSFKIIKN